jgi:hypothetical protein
MRRWLLVPLSAALVSCGADLGTGVPAVRSIRVEPAAALAVGVGDTVRVRAVVMDAEGLSMSPPPLDLEPHVT